MATYKITDTELNKITKLLDKIVKDAKHPIFPGITAKSVIKVKELSKEIKNNYIKIK
jgi:hypothetical protein